MATPGYLTPQTVTIPLRAGLDKKTSEKSVDPPSLLAVENASFDSPGEIRKDRPYQITQAMTTILGQTPVTPIDRAIAVNDLRDFYADSELYSVLDQGKSALLTANSVSPGQGVFASTSARSVAAFTPRRDTVIWDGDYAYANGYELFIESNFSTRVNYRFSDATTGARLFASNQNLAAGGVPRAVAMGNYLCLVWPDSDGTVKIIQLDTANIPTSLTGSTFTVSSGDFGTMKVIDVATDPTAGAVWVAYHSTAPGIRIVKRILSSGSQTSVVATATPTGNVLAIGVVDNGSAGLLAWCETAAGVKVSSFTSTPAITASATENAAATIVNRMGIGGGTVNRMLVAYEDVTSGTSNVTTNWITLATAAASTRILLYGYSLAHKPYQLADNHVWGIAYTEGNTAAKTNTYYATILHDADGQLTVSGYPVAWYLSGIADPRSNKGALPSISYHAPTGELRWMGTERTSIAKRDSLGVDFFAAFTVLSLRFSDGNAVPFLNNYALPGNAYRDREGLLDIAWHFPPTITAVSWSGGGALTNGATYEWVAYYECVDSNGNLRRSVPSDPFVSTATNTRAQITFTQPFMRPGANGVTLVLCRSLANLGAPHYTTNQNGPGDRLSAFTNTMFDAAGDTTIATQSQLYTDSGILACYPPPMGRFWALHQNRIWSIDEHSQELRYTRVLTVGEGPAWHPNLTVPLSTDRIVAKALVSSPTGLWVLGVDRNTGTGTIAIVVGEGPGDTGTGASYTVQRIEGCNVGITSPNAFVSTPAGIFFEDPLLGIHVLSLNGGMPTPVGLPVESLRAGKTLVRPVLIQDRHEVRFVYSDASMLCFDYVVNQWFTRQVGGHTYNIVDTCVWDGQHVLTDSTFGFFQQQTTINGKDSVFGSGGTYVPTKITTGWIKLADFEGLQRVWDLYLLGHIYDACALAVTVYYDYDDTSSDTYNFADTDLPSSGPMELRLSLRRQTATAIKVSAVDSQSASGTTHAGYGLNAFRLRYGVYERGQRLRASRVEG